MNTINWKSIWQQSWPHLVAIGIFVVLVMVYFAPQVFEGKQLPQGDMISSYGMGHDAKEYHEQTGEWSHWSNAMFGGIDKLKFKKMVVPGDTLKLEVKIIKRKGPIGVGEAIATVDGKIAAKGELTFALV